MIKNKITGRLYLGYTPIVFNSSLLKAYDFIYSKDRIDINNRLMNFKYSFLKGDILSIEPYKTFSVFTKDGIIINHKVKAYHPYVIFLFSGIKSNDLIENIKKSGFFDGDILEVDKNTIDEVRKIQYSRLKLTPFIKIYIFLVVLFIVCYFIFDWDFLSNIRIENKHISF